MSFSRAPLKRFNEHVGCAPAPGTYEIKPGELKGAASFEKSDRFRPVKAAAGAFLPPSSPSRSILGSPVRRTLSVDGLAEGLSGKKGKNAMTVDKKQQKLLEKEIRILVQQRGEQDLRLLTLEEEMKKVEAKLLTAVRERTGLAASVATLERQRAELKKINEFLKSKVSADTTKKRISSLTMELMDARNTLDAKNKELNVLQINSEGQLKVVETDLLASRATVSALNERNNDLEELHEVMKTQYEELQNENARLHAVIRELKKEVRVVQEYLDTANDEIQDLRFKLQEKTQENIVSGSQLEKVKQLENELLHCTADLRQKEEQALNFHQELQTSKDALLEAEKRLGNRELELKSSQKAVMDMEKQMSVANQQIHNSQITARQQEAELARLREELRRTENELDERVAHLEQRCLLSEEERCKTQEEGLRRVQELKTELVLLNEVKRDEKKRQIELQEEHAALTEELTKEKALVDSLSVLVKQEREESEEKLKQLTEEMEEVLGELAVLEDQDQKRQEMLERSQEAAQKLQEDNDDLERQLRETRAVLESTKEAPGESRKEMEQEMETATQQMKEEMDREIGWKEEEIRRMQVLLKEHQETQQAEAKAREENARILLEVQTRLAQKSEELKVVEKNYTALISQFQQEMELEKREKKEALVQLEEQRAVSVTLLQEEKDKAQKRLEEAILQREETSERLKRERDERLRIETALEELRGAMETEKRDLQRVKSEVTRLKGELMRVEEDKRSLLSQVELTDQSRLALEDQLNVAEQESSRLRSHLNRVKREGASFQTRIETMEEAKQALQQQVELLTQEKVTLQWETEEHQRELQRRMTEAHAQSSSSAETEHWRQQYEELFAKVKPFQEQLDAFAAERNALLNENGVNQDKLNRLADAYAHLLGHQNQKQKIKHVMKLKDENISLKQEVSKLRCQVSRQKSDVEQLRSKLPGAPRRRFDPSKAFQHDKENRQSEKTEPLKEGNH